MAIQTLRTGEVEVGTLLVAAVREVWEDGLLVALPFHLLGEVPADHTVDLPDFEARGADTGELLEAALRSEVNNFEK